MENSSAPTRNIEALTDALVQWAGMGEQIIQHMRRFAGDEPAPPIEVVLTEVIGGTIAPLSDRHAAADLEAAVAVLNAAIDTLADEILLFEPER
jgi:hypothetical protein